MGLLQEYLAELTLTEKYILLAKIYWRKLLAILKLPYLFFKWLCNPPREIKVVGYWCTDCGQEFKSWTDLQWHKKHCLTYLAIELDQPKLLELQSGYHSLPDQVPTIMCTLCGETFEHLSKFHDHQAANHFVCKLCNRVFATGEELGQHGLDDHTKPMPYAAIATYTTDITDDWGRIKRK